MIRVAALVALFTLAGCQPAPRAASYFRAHPDETRVVLADCASGARRSAECDNAQAADAQLKSDARLSLYKKSF